MPADASQSLSVRLRAQTRDAHEHAESSLNLMSDNFTRDDYLHLLRRWLGFYRAWEPIAVGHFGSFWEGRDKSAWLETDLASLGDRAGPIETLAAPDLRAETLTDALGVLYVTEGATLGGQHIAKRLAARLQVTRDHGARFFTGYGDQTVVRWSQTKALLDASTVAPEAVIQSAKRTFALLADWLPRRSA